MTMTPIAIHKAISNKMNMHNGDFLFIHKMFMQCYNQNSFLKLDKENTHTST